MIEKFSITIPELSGRKKRNAYVYIPDAILENPEERYPVLYMFDGHNVFFDEDATYGKSWGMEEFVADTQLPMIIAAVECNHAPNNGRIKEYSPFNFRVPRFGAIKGRGHTTMEWFVNTFKPYIDDNYPTIPDREHTFIAGSSMGGLMSLYAITAYNHIFSRCAALSPSLWAGQRKMMELFSTAPLAENTVVYMDYGQKELASQFEMAPILAKAASILVQRGALLDWRIVPGGEHNEATWEKQLPFIMNTLFYGLDEEETEPCDSEEMNESEEN